MDCGHNSGTDKVAEMQEFVADLMTDPDREQIASEIMGMALHQHNIIHLTHSMALRQYCSRFMERMSFICGKLLQARALNPPKHPLHQELRPVM